MNCPACSSKIEDGAAFCPICGTAIAAQPAEIKPTESVAEKSIEEKPKAQKPKKKNR